LGIVNTQEVPKRLLETAHASSQKVTLKETRVRESDLMLELYRIYDEQFAIRRLQQMSYAELSAQSWLILERSLADLSSAALSREQQRALLASFTEMVKLLLHCKSSQRCEQTRSVLDLQGRWRNGHHLFGLCCYFCRYHLSLAASCEEPQEVAGHLDLAGIHLWASSAAMAYTTDFPASLYQSEIRAHMPAGFSGSHNSDFNHLKLMKGKLAVHFRQRWGAEPQQWPPEILRAVRHFRDLDLLDLDQHILVAASRIGFSPSLKQSAHGEDDLSALDGLRHVAQARRHDFLL